MEEIAKQVYVETTYDGVNVGAMVTPTGVICIDVPSYARDARDWAARMHRLSPYPVLHIILTDCHGDRILNTRWLNAPIIMHQDAADLLSTYDKRFPPHLLDSLNARNPHRGRELSSSPIEHPAMSFSGEMVMFKHGQQLVLRSAPGPNVGNAWVMLPERGVIFAGDTFYLGMHPLLTMPNSAAWLQTLEQLRGYVKTHTIVPGRGAVLPPGSPEVAKSLDDCIEFVSALHERVATHVAQQRPRDGLVTYIPELMNRFPAGQIPPDWIRQQIRSSLSLVFDELSVESAAAETE